MNVESPDGNLGLLLEIDRKYNPQYGDCNNGWISSSNGSSTCSRSLGVTVWELFELGNQPYRHYSDRQVLTYAVKEQQLKLHRPQLQFALAERW